MTGRSQYLTSSNNTADVYGRCCLPTAHAAARRDRAVWARLHCNTAWQAANAWEGSLPDTFRQTERKCSAKLTGVERSHPAFEDDFELCSKSLKAAYAAALIKNRQVTRTGYCCRPGKGFQGDNAMPPWDVQGLSYRIS